MSDALFEIWRRLQFDFFGKVDRGRLVVAEMSGHYVHHDQPSLVFDAILKVCDLGVHDD